MRVKTARSVWRTWQSVFAIRVHPWLSRLLQNRLASPCGSRYPRVAMPNIMSPSFGGAALVEARKLMHALDHEPAHVEQVTRIALGIFDALSPFTEGGGSERLILEVASLLHDIGWSESEDGKRHHKISARLILEHPWQTLPPEATLRVACVARYHRRAAPRPGHKLYATLSPKGQKQVGILAGILRIADGLDRTHLQRVRRVTLTRGDLGVHLGVEGSVNLRAEIQGALRKADVFEEAFGGRLEIEQA
jgi:exopolyphosphatase/guanosine-5'-triphosphate,3'-diphosphate pyrophosphatase